MEEQDADVEVVRMIYTGSVPPGASSSALQLLRMYIISDRLQVPAVASACYAALGLLGPETMCLSTIQLLFSDILVLLYAASPDAAVARLRGSGSSALAWLLEQFGNVPRTLADVAEGGALARFCLPCEAVKTLAGCGQLQVDSENCVLVLMSEWVHAAAEVEDPD